MNSHCIAKIFYLLAFFFLITGCSVAQRSLAIDLDETPLFSKKQWAVVNMPYIKVHQSLAGSQISDLLGMVRFGHIVEIQRIEKNLEDDHTMWAFIIWELNEKDTNTSFSVNDKQMRGWVPYSFLHIVDNLKEALLARKQMLQETQPPLVRENN